MGEKSETGVDIRMRKELLTFIYGLSFRAAKRTKELYFRQRVESFNRGLAETITGDWDEKGRMEEYRSNVLPYWAKYCRQPKRFWFELAGSRDHIMNPRFIPSDLYYLELLPYLNNMNFSKATEDKNYLKMRFPDVKQAKTVCCRIAGEYYDDTMNLISQDDAVRLCRDTKSELFIKPSVYSGYGKGIQKFYPSECTDERVTELFEETGPNFIVQEKIKQHPALASLNPDSVNTVRILSLFLDGSVYIPNMYLRIGTSGTSHVVVGSEYNAEIMPNGHVSQKVCLDEGCWLDNAEERIIDEGFSVPEIERLCDLVRKVHPRVGHFKWIGWDLTIDEDGDPLLIEFNTDPGDSAQRVCGRPLFGEMTDRVLEDYFHERRLENLQRRGSWSTNEDIRMYRE